MHELKTENRTLKTELTEEYGFHPFVLGERTVSLRAMLSSCGRERRESVSYDWNGLARGSAEFAVWQRTLAGEGELTWEGKTRALRPGDLMLVVIPHDHRYRLPERSPFWVFDYVCFHGREAIRLARGIIAVHGPAFTLPPESASGVLASRIVAMARAGELDDPWTVSSLAYELLMKTALDAARASDEESPKPGWSRRVAAFCAENLSCPITVDDMAAAAGYSRFHFSREFKRTFGASPAAYLRGLRLDKALSMLRMGRSSVKEIADACGFQTASYFSRAFRKRFGAAPGEFR